MSKTHILLARAVFPEIVDKLSRHFHVSANQNDVVWNQAQLIEQLKGHHGVFTTGGDRIDSDVLAA